MDRPAGPVLRWVRACLLAAVSIGRAVGAHTSAGGTVPAPAALAVVFVASAAVAAALLGRPASALRVAGLLVASQAFVHLWLTVASIPAGRDDMAGMTDTANIADVASIGHDHAAMVGSGGSASGLAAMDMHMALGHVLAASGWRWGSARCGSCWASPPAASVTSSDTIGRCEAGCPSRLRWSSTC
jgi:hypothetical protein